jgi:hypothetical protein
MMALVESQPLHDAQNLAGLGGLTPQYLSAYNLTFNVQRRRHSVSQFLSAVQTTTTKCPLPSLNSVVIRTVRLVVQPQQWRP